MTKFNAKYEIYGYLQEIKGVKFTSREVDVISCILHNRGEKKIAYLLSISHKTVGSHVHNIMNKIGKSNRDYVIDFIESSGKLELFKQYYLHLLLYNAFEKALSKIGNLNKKQEKYYWILDEELFKELSSQLELANIILTDNKQDVESGKELKLEKDGDYYLNVLNIVRDIKGNAAIDGIIHDFKQERAALEKSLKTLGQNTIRIWVNKNKIWLWSVFIIVVLLMTVVCVRYYRQYQALLSLDAFLQSEDQFSDVNIKQESAYKNYV
jgi:DNA-binding CsgD family transcriptional regulator